MNITQSIGSLTLLLVCFQIAFCDDYNPLSTETTGDVQTVDLTVRDSDRNRDLPIRVFLPPKQNGALTASKAPVVLFSHGLGGSKNGSAFLGTHWAAHGYVAVFLQHPGSDESVWKEQRLANRMTEMREAASANNLMLRLKDIPTVIDQLEAWNKEPNHVLVGRLDLSKIGMSGHSFGGQTTQGVSGQSFPVVGQRLTDKRISAAIVMSPGSPERGNADQAFGRVSIPWLLMTGTHDTAPIGGQTVESRRKVFPALPPGDKFELVLDGAKHSAFTDRPLPGDSQKRNGNHHRVILGLSTAFWDAYLKKDAEAKNWLNGEGAQRILESADVWSKK
ncbi:MAG: dienelactone hydrolase [Pirellula sp.]|jgi:predicted dienelactone hydrolase|nr:dienelactone hydrolase [Pirellula sp.]